VLRVEVSQVKRGDLSNREDRADAIRFIQRGGLVVSDSRVHGIWFNAEIKSAANLSGEIKGEPGKVRSLMASIPDIWEFVDTNALHESLRKYANKPEELQSHIAGLAFLRLPVKAERQHEIPTSILSVDDTTKKAYIHVLDPKGDPHMSSFIKELNEAGVKFVGVTSLNPKGQPEIINREDAFIFCENRIQKLPLMLENPTTVRNGEQGSYTIFDTEKLSVQREGNVNAATLSYILGVEINTDGMVSAKFNHIKYHEIFRTHFPDIKNPALLRLMTLKSIEQKIDLPDASAEVQKKKIERMIYFDQENVDQMASQYRLQENEIDIWMQLFVRGYLSQDK
jgi:hypothetical protein